MGWQAGALALQTFYLEQSDTDERCVESFRADVATALCRRVTPRQSGYSRNHGTNIHEMAWLLELLRQAEVNKASGRIVDKARIAGPAAAKTTICLGRVLAEDIVATDCDRGVF